MLPALTSPNTAAGESGNNVETTAGLALQSGGTSSRTMPLFVTIARLPD